MTVTTRESFERGTDTFNARLIWLLGSLMAAGLAVAGVAVAQARAPARAPVRATVWVDGNGQFVANRFVRETFHFVHADITIRSGGKLTFADGPELSLPDPHTLTIVNRSELPRTVGELDNCIGDVPSTPCLLGAATSRAPPTRPGSVC